MTKMEIQEGGVGTPAAATDDMNGSVVNNKETNEETNVQDNSKRDNNNNHYARKSSTMSLSNLKSVPVVELTLENVSYRPISTAIIVNRKPPQGQEKQQQEEQKGDGNSKSKKVVSEDEENRITVLSNISTKISPYELSAWMGPSGSGKTSLTSVVAGLISDANAIQGVIKVNGEEGRLPKRLVGVVWQDDLLLSNLTVEETIYFAARLKTSAKISDAQVKSVVEDVMEELGLLHIRNNLIGSPLANIPGISGGERKRTSVAAELVVRPSLLLLDEPTSGLDATTACNLMSTLKDLAKIGHSIAVVIHQPRTDIFKMIDHLLLLSKGHVVYDGAPSKVRAYLESCPSVSTLPPETGIADWIMDTIIADENNNKNANSSNDQDGGNTGSVLANHWITHQKQLEQEQKEESQQQQQDAKKQLKPYFRQHSLTELEETLHKFEASFFKQLSLLMSRTLKQRRGERITKVTVLLTFAYLLFTSLFWWRLPNNTNRIFERNSLLFFMLIAQGNGIVVSSMTVFQQERSLLRRERAKKMYGVFPYFLAKVSSDMTNNVLLPMVYGIITYFTTGLHPGAIPFLKFCLAYYLTLGTAQSMGFFLSVVIPTTRISLILAPPITLFFLIIGGFYIPLANMHVGIRWASYISFARYGYSALLVNEFAGREIECSGEDTAVSIGEFAGGCPLPGEAVFESIGIEGIFANYWFNVAMVAVLELFFLLAAYGLLRRSK